MKIIIMAGSQRKESFNKKLAQFVAQLCNKQEAVHAEFIDLKDYPMPLYDGDYEEEHGLPEGCIELKKKFIEADAFILACPEYNSSITPLLKNTIDWISRPQSKEEAPLSCFTNKRAALCAASPGALGGLRGLSIVRSLLGSIGVWVAPNQVAIPKAHEILNNESISDDQTRSKLESMIHSLIA